MTEGNNSTNSSNLITVSSLEGDEDDARLGHGFPAVYLQQHPGQVLPPAELTPGPLNATDGLNTTITKPPAGARLGPTTAHGPSGSQPHQVLRRHRV